MSGFESDSFALSMLTLSTHIYIGSMLIWIFLADLIILILLTIFSYRFGRFASAGVVLSLVGLPGVVFYLLANQYTTVSGTIRLSESSDGLNIVGSAVSYMAPLLLPHLADVYLICLVSGVSLLAVAAIGRSTYSMVKHNQDRVNQRNMINSALQNTSSRLQDRDNK